MYLEAKHVGAHLMVQLCHLKAEKNKLNLSECLLSQILFLCFVCLCYVFSFHSVIPFFLIIVCMFQSYNDNL